MVPKMLYVSGAGKQSEWDICSPKYLTPTLEILRKKKQNLAAQQETDDKQELQGHISQWTRKKYKLHYDI